AQVRDQDRAPDGSHFGAIRPKGHIEMRRMQDFPHEPQDQIVANNCSQGHQEKARSFTHFGPSCALERPIPVQSKSIESAKSVGNGIEEEESSDDWRWTAMEKSVETEVWMCCI